MPSHHLRQLFLSRCSNGISHSFRYSISLNPICNKAKPDARSGSAQKSQQISSDQLKFTSQFVNAFGEKPSGHWSFPVDHQPVGQGLAKFHFPPGDLKATKVIWSGCGDSSSHKQSLLKHFHGWWQNKQRSDVFTTKSPTKVQYPSVVDNENRTPTLRINPFQFTAQHPVGIPRISHVLDEFPSANVGGELSSAYEIVTLITFLWSFATSSSRYWSNEPFVICDEVHSKKVFPCSRRAENYNSFGPDTSVGCFSHKSFCSENQGKTSMEARIVSTYVSEYMI